MGLVKTRRLAYPPLAGVRDPWGSEHAERSECRAMRKQQRAKAGMKPRKISVPGKRVRQQGLDWRQPGKQP